ncbi:MAG TPA: RNA 3'-terminal phosphate cyclase [Pyrinomonadaceae bacterium]|jgi:RNA 3'-terminal phosphate cyclase (ATP)|nr:RNA 3'-terminal phosphate cyclase [Pyrinomonadaceae bacterium]
MITIDGSHGEGGGQIIRTSLALSLITGKPFRIYNVRARREKPGLQRQHLTAVRAAAAIGGAEVEGAGLGATAFTFHPGAVTPGDYAFPIGTAGSTTLVLQTILPPLMIASAPSTLVFEGGTHNVHAPPYEFIVKTFLPLVNRMGARVTTELMRYGFYPPGGGSFRARVEPASKLRPLELLTRGEIRARRARALVVKLPPAIGERELGVVSEQLGWGESAGDELRVETSQNASSPGNVLTLEIESEHLTEVFTGIGERGVRAETVAERASAEARAYLDTDAPVGEHLADQLLIPYALAGGGSYTTGQPSLHTTTNIEVIKMFLDVEISARPSDSGVWKIEVR